MATLAEKLKAAAAKLRKTAEVKNEIATTVGAPPGASMNEIKTEVAATKQTITETLGLPPETPLTEVTTTVTETKQNLNNHETAVSRTKTALGLPSTAPLSTVASTAQSTTQSLTSHQNTMNSIRSVLGLSSGASLSAVVSGVQSAKNSTVTFYKCASVDTADNTWTGYKAVLADGAYSFATSATSGLTYGTGYTPVVGKIYSEDAMIVVSGLWQNVITEGLVFRASFTNSLTAETGQDMSDLPSGCSIDELDGKTCLVYDGTVSDSKYSKGKVSDERFAVGKGPFTVTSWVAKGDAGYNDAVVFWWMGDNSPVIFRGRWFNGYTMIDHRGSYGHLSVQTQNNEWVFLAASRTGNDVSVYINGELVSTISCSESFPEEAFHIMPGGSTVKYMRDFRFYDRALTADEIAVVMREGE